MKMKNYIFIFNFIFFYQSCSFDNKSGIWKNEKNQNNKKKKLFKDLKLYH